MEVGAKGPVFDWDTIFQMLRNGRCAQTVGPRSKIFSSEKPPYWVVLTPLSNQNLTEKIYGPVSEFSHSHTLKYIHEIVIFKSFWNLSCLKTSLYVT